jgi:hypothetical protein
VYGQSQCRREFNVKAPEATITGIGQGFEGNPFSQTFSSHLITSKSVLPPAVTRLAPRVLL